MVDCVCGEDSDRSLHFATGDVDKGCLEIVVKLASLLPESLPVFMCSYWNFEK